MLAFLRVGAIGLVALVARSDVRSQELQAGVAVADITPPVPWRMSGYFNERVSTGVKDPLHAKAIVLRQGDVSAALVFCDLVGIPRDVSRRARSEASQATGIPADAIAVAATHSHTGPLFFGPLRDELRQRSIKRRGSDPLESLDYSAELAAKISAAIVEANSKLQPVELSAGYAREERLAFNRRFHMRDGSVRFNPGQQNPDIVRAAGPIDPQVGILSLKGQGEDRPFAAVVAYALHLDTTSGTEYSADYPRFLEDSLRKTFGKEFVALFAAGTCGDINHIDVKTKGTRRPEEIGAMLVEPVVGALSTEALSPVAQPSLAVRSTTVDAPLQTYSAEEIARARENMELIGENRLPFLEEVKAYSITAVQCYQRPSVPLEVQAFRLSNDAAIVTLPAEIFVELGLAIKAGSPFKTTLVVELTNDSLGYIPTKKAFAEGSYETVNSRVQPGTGEALVDAAVRLLKELK
jgi:neutral ceramidase